MTTNAPTLPRLMLVTDRARTRRRPLARVVDEAVTGGVGIVQVREKDLSTADRLAVVRELTAVVDGRARIVVNSDVAAAQATDSGLHLPAAVDMPAVRPTGLLGRSTHDDDEIRIAVADGVDYVLFGPAFPTRSKPGHRGAGVDAVRHAAHRAAPIRLFAIGGVTTSRIPSLLHAGAWGVAVCSAILAASNPRRIAEAMTLALTVSSPSANPSRRD